MNCDAGPTRATTATSLISRRSSRAAGLVSADLIHSIPLAHDHLPARWPIQDAPCRRAVPRLPDAGRHSAQAVCRAPVAGERPGQHRPSRGRLGEAVLDRRRRWGGPEAVFRGCGEAIQEAEHQPLARRPPAQISGMIQPPKSSMYPPDRPRSQQADVQSHGFLTLATFSASSSCSSRDPSWTACISGCMLRTAACLTMACLSSLCASTRKYPWPWLYIVDPADYPSTVV